MGRQDQEGCELFTFYIYDSCVYSLSTNNSSKLFLLNILWIDTDIFFYLTDRKLKLNDSQFAAYPISSLNPDNSHIQMFQFSHYDNQRLYDGTHNQLF